MKLYMTKRSPYVRKVRVCAMELGLEGEIECIDVDLANPEDEFLAANPLGKVPALVTGEGLVLFDSPVICEYLDHLHSWEPLFPVAESPGGTPRWRALIQQALGGGIMDAAVLNMLEKERPNDQQSSFFVDRRSESILRALDQLEASSVYLGVDDITIGDICVGCALGYLDFRFPYIDWRAGRSSLNGWFEGFCARESMILTVPGASASSALPS